MNYKAINLTILTILFIGLDVKSQSSVNVGETIRITNENSTPFVEPHLAVNPTNPNNMVVGVMAAPGTKEGIYLRIYYTMDGGKTWLPSELNKENIKGADPWLAFSTNGEVFYTYLSGSTAELRKSSDGGKSWGKKVLYPKENQGSYDYVKMDIDKSGTIYLWAAQNMRLESGMRLGSASLLTSTDNGESIEHKEFILPGNLSYQVGDMALLNDGTSLFSFHEIDYLHDYVEHPRLWAVRSEDSGNSFSVPFLVDQNYVADSPDLAVSNDDKVYISWMELEKREGGLSYSNNYLSKSVDRGETWSNPIITNDTLQVAEHPAHHPRVAVNKKGIVALSWKDPRNSDQKDCFDLYFTISENQGETFSKDIRISNETTCADVEGNRVEYTDGLSIYRRYGDGGDYHGLSALPNGSFQIVWADSRSGTYQLYTTNVEME